ncbi:unnamed protein product [Aphanomyces euteiches]|uniref:Uncharacterized protein n=1 Tax=Aphanomyces euteiches TaxID=100861 RepID=A0A6G0X3Y4_9STRA|nr:hypothetical protein Ae201684_008768 [Aphanomyces euteiches]KAH9085977.1 hypothetical protein Ae201684P_005673 [Aphanomyces euteiches]
MALRILRNVARRPWNAKKGEFIGLRTKNYNTRTTSSPPHIKNDLFLVGALLAAGATVLGASQYAWKSNPREAPLVQSKPKIEQDVVAESPKPTAMTPESLVKVLDEIRDLYEAQLNRVKEDAMEKIDDDADAIVDTFVDKLVILEEKIYAKHSTSRSAIEVAIETHQSLPNVAAALARCSASLAPKGKNLLSFEKTLDIIERGFIAFAEASDAVNPESNDLEPAKFEALLGRKVDEAFVSQFQGDTAVNDKSLQLAIQVHSLNPEFRRKLQALYSRYMSRLGHVGEVRRQEDQ